MEAVEPVAGQAWDPWDGRTFGSACCALHCGIAPVEPWGPMAGLHPATARHAATGSSTQRHPLQCDLTPALMGSCPKYP
eukprot:Skav221601  [mRNA]  locus=scaffold1698:553981:556911:+ [translate_table: standard]